MSFKTANHDGDVLFIQLIRVQKTNGHIDRLFVVSTDAMREVYADSIFTAYIGIFNAVLRYIQHYASVDASPRLPLKVSRRSGMSSHVKR